MTAMCKTCRYSEGRASMLAGAWVLWCTRWATVAERACGEWERVPGADDE